MIRLATRPAGAGRGAPAPAPATVNLLSRQVLDAAARRRLRHQFTAAAAALAVVLLAAIAGQQGLVIAASRDLGREQARARGLAAQTTALAGVARFYAQVTANQDAVMQTMSREVLYSDVTAGLRNNAPRGVTVTNVSMVVDTTAPTAAAPAPGTPTAGPGSGCPAPDPFTARPGVGCVTLAGSAANREDIGKLVSNLLGDDRFVNPFVSTTTVGADGRVAFTATVGLTAKVYSGRYRTVDFLKGSAQ